MTGVTNGFACYIKSENGNYLFDTGRGLGIPHNSLGLKKELSKIKATVISHGHLDHTGGLAKVLQIRREIDVYGHPDIFSNPYSAKLPSDLVSVWNHCMLFAHIYGLQFPADWKHIAISICYKSTFRNTGSKRFIGAVGKRGRFAGIPFGRAYLESLGPVLWFLFY